MQDAFDTGEFIALNVPEEGVRERLNGRIDELKQAIAQMAEKVHREYHWGYEMTSIKSWQDCSMRICTRAQSILHSDDVKGTT